jgi:hypothetical protein
MNQLRYSHMLVGILFLVVFVGSGQYMDLALDHLDGMPDGPRLMYRSAHIYLLFSALLNLLLGCYLQPLDAPRPRLMQRAGSVLILASPLLLVVSFFMEAEHANLERPVAATGLYLVALGVALHFFSRFVAKR